MFKKKRFEEPEKEKPVAVIAPERDPMIWKRDSSDAITIAGKLAGGTLYCRNFKFRNAAQHFPIEPLMRTVDKFFQFAPGGALYVDEPKDKRGVENCQRKAEVMRKEGLRYVYITKEMTLREAQEQLAFNQGAA